MDRRTCLGMMLRRHCPTLDKWYLKTVDDDDDDDDDDTINDDDAMWRRLRGVSLRRRWVLRPRERHR